jgi:hypothetical protein
MLKKISSFLGKLISTYPRIYSAIIYIGVLFLCILLLYLVISKWCYEHRTNKVYILDKNYVSKCIRSEDCFTQWIPINPDPG